MSIRVLIADDSRTTRTFVRETLETHPGIQVVGEASNGLEAVDRTVELRPDLVIMDVHMPAADGLEATQRIMRRAPTPIIVVSGSTRSSDVELSLSATRAGALMALPKPEASSGPARAAFQRELIAMVLAMSQVKVVRRWQPDGAPPPTPPPPPRPARIRAVAIGCSTGGPPALQRIFEELPGNFPCPILVVQHIAKGFGDGFRDWLAGGTDLDVRIAAAREIAQAGSVYLAPDDHHITVDWDGRIRLSTSEAVGGFRPSATCLFRGAAEAFGPALAAVIMSGMGDDGVAGLVDVKRRGGYVMAQDEASSVVYGMAKEAVRAGLADTILPLAAIAAHLMRLVRPEGPAR